MVHVLVTGGAGFIGAHVTRDLLARPEVETVTVLDDLSSGDARNIEGTGARLIVGSVMDQAAVDEAASAADSIIHLAAQVSVPESVIDPATSFEVNVTGSFHVLEAARLRGAHLVFASSAAVYGDDPQLPTSERDTTAPASPYASGKLAAEVWLDAYRRCYRLDALVFRFFNVFGPLQAADHAYAAVIPAFMDAIVAQRPLTVFGDGRQTRDFVFAPDLAGVVGTAVARRVTSDRPVNLAVGHHVSLLELIAILEDVSDRRLEVEHAAPRPGDVRHSRADTSLMRRVFGEPRPTPLASSLAQTLEWTRWSR